mgnify:CR=1 FL=1
MVARNGVSYSQAARDYYKQAGGASFLDNQYTVFGYVVKGFEVIDAIADVKVNPKAGDRPISDVRMISVRVIE